MRKLYSILSVFIITAIFISCGSNSSEIKVGNVKLIENESDLKDFFKIVPGTYPIELVTAATTEGSKLQADIKLELKKTKETKGYKLEYKKLYLIPKDKDGNVLKDDMGDDIKILGNNLHELMWAKVEDRLKLSFSYYLPNDEIKESFMNNIHSFDVYCKVEKDVQYQETSISTSNSSDNDWDSVLDDYEKFVDKYIKLFKKAQNGDTSAITEYAECLEKAQGLQEKLENAKSNLTSKQANRLAKIINKFSNAITSAL